ncbi:MAG: pyruvate formate lyase family protein, partial [Eisenbergiella sp.]
MAEGISHVIDSLCAIRRVVFQEKYCTMTELADAIDHNFEGNEKLRNKLDSCPKYGANEEEADEIGVRLTHDYAELM